MLYLFFLREITLLVSSTTERPVKQQTTKMKRLNHPYPFKEKLGQFFKNTLVVAYAAIGIALVFNLTPGLNINDSSVLSMVAFVNPGQVQEKPLDAFPIPEGKVRYGMVIDTFHLEENTIKKNEFLADMLLKRKIDYIKIDELVKNTKDVFDIRNLREGKKYVFLYSDTTQAPDFMVYEPSVYNYYIFDLKDSLNVKKMERPIEKRIRTAGGKIESSLWNAMIDNGMNFELAAKMEDALQWSIDFHHLLKNDEFKLVFEEDYIDGKAVGIGQLKAAYYKNVENPFFAIYFEGKEEKGFFNLEGKPMRKAFLKAPIKYSYRISSKYNLNRFHPILKRRRPHLGTDYAAPYGTPIQAVGDGVIVKAGYTKGNGNFIKIRHNDTYQTQYLHMQRFAKGMRPGVHVQQGETIGYVGSTGLATGPHVCFRFWKNGRQINHLNLTFPASKPLNPKDLPEYIKVRDHYLEMMDFEHLITKPEMAQDTIPKVELSAP